MKLSGMKKWLVLGLCGLLSLTGVSAIVVSAQQARDKDSDIETENPNVVEFNMWTWIAEDGKIIQMPMATFPGAFEFNGMKYVYNTCRNFRISVTGCYENIVAVILRESEIEAYLKESQKYPYIIDNSIIDFDGTKKIFLYKHRDYDISELLILGNGSVYISENFFDIDKE